MAKEKNEAVLDASADHLPEHGPIDDEGREVLLSLKHVDKTSARARTSSAQCRTLALTYTRARPFRSWASPAPARPQ